jgi:hypothetical protein
MHIFGLNSMYRRRLCFLSIGFGKIYMFPSTIVKSENLGKKAFSARKHRMSMKNAEVRGLDRQPPAGDVPAGGNRWGGNAKPVDTGKDRT